MRLNASYPAPADLLTQGVDIDIRYGMRRLQPAERGKLARRVGTALRRVQQQRIAAQKNPESGALEAVLDAIAARRAARAAA